MCARGAPTRLPVIVRAATHTMHVIDHTCLPRDSAEGRECQTVASPALCGVPFEVRVLRLAPGAATPAGCCERAQVVLVLGGSGKERRDGGPQGFHAPCTLHVPAGAEHQIVNNGVTTLQLVVIAAPVTEAASASPP